MIMDRVYNCVSNCGCADDLNIYDHYLARHPALRMAIVCSLDQGHWSLDVEQSPEVESMKDKSLSGWVRIAAWSARYGTEAEINFC